MTRNNATPRHVPRVADVIPIRTDTVERPTRVRGTLRRSAPVATRPWQVLLVPPTPGSRTRAFAVARWQARLALGTGITLLAVTIAAVSVIVMSMRSPDLFTSGEEMAALRARLSIAEDSLAQARIALEGNEEPDSIPAAASDRPTPFSRVRLGSSPPSSSSVRSAIQGLPVMGLLASRFSLARRHPILHIMRPHLGIDVSAPAGTRISAPAAGRVAFVGRKFGFGLVVEVDHGGAVITRYAHCRSALVRQGDVVAGGAAIATVGSSGLATGPHLHYEVLVNGRPVDPLRFHFAPSDGVPLP